MKTKISYKKIAKDWNNYLSGFSGKINNVTLTATDARYMINVILARDGYRLVNKMQPEDVANKIRKREGHGGIV